MRRLVVLVLVVVLAMAGESGALAAAPKARKPAVRRATRTRARVRVRVRTRVVCRRVAGRRRCTRVAIRSAPKAPPAPPMGTSPEVAIVFPVRGGVSYTNTFGACRASSDGNPCGRHHEGQDLMSAKLTPVVAAHDGIITAVGQGGTGGFSVTLRHENGWFTYYAHLNNDTPGTDDGLGVPWPASTVVGRRVNAGDVIGYVGDSGNAEAAGSHCHFELHRPRNPDGTGGEAVDAHGLLRVAQGYPA